MDDDDEVEAALAHLLVFRQSTSTSGRQIIIFEASKLGTEGLRIGELEADEGQN